MPSLELLIDQSGRTYRPSEIVAKIKRVNQALCEWSATLAEAITPALEVLVNGFDRMLTDIAEENSQVEWAYRRYAAEYNKWHVGHKVSWRRLNRQQRRQAIFDAAPTIMDHIRREVVDTPPTQAVN